MISKDKLKRDKNALENWLIKNGYNGQDKFFLCPNPEHDDHNPSANLYENTFGEVYVKCFSCGFHADIFSLNYLENGVDIKETLEEYSGNQEEVKHDKKMSGFDTIQAVRDFLENGVDMELIGLYKYSDEFYVLRYFKFEEGTKTFRAVTKVKDKWKIVEPKAFKPSVYGNDKLRDISNVLIVEGEKCADHFNALHISDWVAVTSWGGTNNYYKTDWTSILDKNIFFWRDNDSPGIKYQTNVVNTILGLNPEANIKIVDIDSLDLGEGGDIADLVEKTPYEDRIQTIETALNTSKQFKYTDSLDKRIKLIEEGEYKSIPFPMFPLLSSMAQTLVPGSVTMLCGNPGSAKSFLMLDLGLSLMDDPSFTDKFRFMFLEEDSAFYQLRALAQLSNNSNYTRLEYVRANAEKVRNDFDFYQDNLEKLFKHVDFGGSKLLTSAAVANWVKQQAYSGTRLIVVDPITATKPNAKQWIDDSEFLFSVKETLEETGASLILTTHPRMGGKGLQGMARSLNFSNFTQYVLWLIDHRPKDSYIDLGGNESEIVKHGKTLYIEKTRNGQGNGRQIAIDLDIETLRFKEHGLILSEEEVAMKISEF